MNILPYPLLKIGIIGGGQLGKMTAQVAKQMGFYVTVLDPTPNCPAAQIADHHIVGSLYDADKLAYLVYASDVTTYEVEHIDATTLALLANAEHAIHPAPQLLAVIQDKLLQKQRLLEHGIPTPKFEAIEELTPKTLHQLDLPIVQKARKGGYDGRGVAVLKAIEDVDKILSVPSMLEELVDFEKEIAVIVARNIHGEIQCYPVVDMFFDDRTNICDIVAAPADLPTDIAEKAQRIAIQTVEVLEGVGVFGIEMFLTKDKQILVNEIAPRPHNSGHYTIEACVTSQFEQHIRAICGLPLGSPQLLTPSVMMNLLGEPDYEGSPVVEGLADILAIPGLSFHLYGKEETKPFRKMGHVTIVAEIVADAMKKLEIVKRKLKIKSKT